MTSENKTPCIVYRRSRYAERRADHFAQKQQDEAEEALAARGFEIVGRYGDPEFAAPFAGYLEPRPAWQMALDAAAEKCVMHGNCSLIVLRSDGIGDGDPFLPDRGLLAEYARVDITVAGLSYRGHPTDTNLAAAHRNMDTFMEVERAEPFNKLIKLGRSADQPDVILRRDPFRNVVRAYYANHGQDDLRVRWQALRKGPGARCTVAPSGRLGRTGNSAKIGHSPLFIRSGRSLAEYALVALQDRPGSRNQGRQYHCGAAGSYGSIIAGELVCLRARWTWL